MPVPVPFFVWGAGERVLPPPEQFVLWGAACRPPSFSGGGWVPPLPPAPLFPRGGPPVLSPAACGRGGQGYPNLQTPPDPLVPFFSDVLFIYERQRPCTPSTDHRESLAVRGASDPWRLIPHVAPFVVSTPLTAGSARRLGRRGGTPAAPETWACRAKAACPWTGNVAMSMFLV